MKISVIIPCYEMRGLGKMYLKQNLDMLAKQTFKDFEVIVSDNSTCFYASDIENLCKQYPFVRYFKYSVKGISANTNYAIKQAKGELIKFIFQDDYLYNEHALAGISGAFKGHWLVTACEHDLDGKLIRPFYPTFHKDIHLGNNTISSPSVLTIKNDNPLLFDENLTMLLDVDMYKRLYDKFGEPTILNEINVVNTVGSHQISRNMNSEAFEQELKYVKIKYQKE